MPMYSHHLLSNYSQPGTIRFLVCVCVCVYLILYIYILTSHENPEIQRDTDDELED